MEAEMATSGSVPAPAADEASKRPQVINKYYSKKRSQRCRNGKEAPNNPKLHQQLLPRSALSRQPLLLPAIATYHNEGYYEIDHGKLPPKSPIHLKTIRVVKVSECTSLDVTVSFPSLLALRSYFSYSPASPGGSGPELDERFVMSCNQAARILRRRLAEDELPGGVNQESFWVVTPRLYDFTPQPPSSPPPHLLPPAPAPAPIPAPATSSCLLTLKCTGGWGVRRRVKYIGRHRNGGYAPDVNGYDTESSVKEEMVHRALPEDKKSSGRCKKRKREAVATKYGKLKHKGKKDEKKSGYSAKINQNSSRLRQGKERKRVTEADEGDARRGKERWSAERYTAAEGRLLGIMRACAACASAPILRQTLREEARKYIGDTGLLDHLLKHMAGKVAEGGAERFRRRHNADGAMEYWLEPAELAAVRRDAGVSDPYWMPPPGWKPGDAVSPVICASQVQRQVEELAEEVAGVKRDMELLSSNLMQVDMVTMGAKSEADRYYTSWQEKYHSLVQQNGKVEGKITAMSSTFQSLKEKYKGVVQQNAKLEEQVISLKEKCLTLVQNNRNLEEQMGTISSSFQSFKEEMLLLIKEKDMKMEIDQAAVVPKEPSKSESSHDEKQQVAAGEMPDNADVSNLLAAASLIDGSGSARSSSGGSGSGGKRTPRKSGFRICKPQGTFLWPNMASGMTISGGGSSSCPVVGPRPPPPAGLLAEVVAANADAAATYAPPEDQLIMFGGLPTPPSASSTNALCPPKLLVLPTPTSPIRSPPPPVATAGNAPMPPSYSGPNLQPLHMEVSSSSSAPCCAGLLEGKKAMFEAETGRSDVGTELALATPSYCCVAPFHQ